MPVYDAGVLAIVVSRDGEPKWRRTYAITEVDIGHRADNQLVLDEESVDARHARVVVRGGEVIAVDLGGARGTFAGGKRLISPVVLRPRDSLVVGAYTLNAFLVDPQPLVAYRSQGPIEREMLEASIAGDDASRLVYADWLEHQGDLARAELLRLQHAFDVMLPLALGLDRAIDRLRELMAGADLAWRSRIARCPIEGCSAYDDDGIACPARWSALTPTERESVRCCDACGRDVHYCGSIYEARAHVARGAPVAIDITSARWPRDLEKPYETFVCEDCQIDVGGELCCCPRCARVPSRHRAVHASEDEPDEPGDNPYEALARRQERSVLLAAMRRLPLKLRWVLELRYCDGLSSWEIADMLGVPVGTVMTRLRDGRRRLDEEIRSAVSAEPL